MERHKISICSFVGGEIFVIVTRHTAKHEMEIRFPFKVLQFVVVRRVMYRVNQGVLMNCLAPPSVHPKMGQSPLGYLWQQIGYLRCLRHFEKSL